ncbi:hypothetical protein [Marinobacter subterrani]|uniref:Uncharacterized protein n=1 Tax=Marinobacter subterrani TaxID=1658765 RepID=A0A0J7JD16_9GAMM|nr:hypothetical protein [Marinobacter subterrani]KMQ75992.1 hypothetical protein Msub_12201 [Marinobacter subterrani]
MLDPQILSGNIQGRTDGCNGGKDSELLIPQIQGKRNRRVIQVFHHVAGDILPVAHEGFDNRRLVPAKSVYSICAKCRTMPLLGWLRPVSRKRMCFDDTSHARAKPNDKVAG